MGLEKALAEAGISMTRTQVGDKYVLEEMLRSGAMLGGEQSGHIIFREHANTGDGLLTARTMIEVLSAAAGPLSRLREAMTVFPQRLINLQVKSKPAIESRAALRAALAASERELGDSGRVVVRYSGTEPLLRIMVEAATEQALERHCGLLEAAFRAELGA
jgi:phosphoglucosamine mutase